MVGSLGSRGGEQDIDTVGHGPADRHCRSAVRPIRQTKRFRTAADAGPTFTASPAANARWGASTMWIVERSDSRHCSTRATRRDARHYLTYLGMTVQTAPGVFDIHLPPGNHVTALIVRN
jgi:hypothetical protein